jgi:Flp pilus assembly CpaE family ATPase
MDSQPEVMQVYFFTAGIESNELNELEGRIRSKLPGLRKVARIEEVTRHIGQEGVTADREQHYIIFPVLTVTSFDRIVSITEQQEHRGVFFIFVSREISASDYKRLVRSGDADWVSLEGAPQEILDIVSRTKREHVASTGAEHARPTFVAFVPSSGGVGNATLALETAVQIKLAKEAGTRRVCLLDLDMQASHICDHLDIEPRLQMQEIAENPDRLDRQLLDLFVSRHAASGIDVLASPRNRGTSVDLSMAVLDALFRMISEQYDLVIIDLPPAWFDWTEQVVSICDLAVVTGLNHVPGLRQVFEILQVLKGGERAPSRIVVALNRCEAGLGGRVARRQHVNQVLGDQAVVYVRQDTAAANHGLNTGVPISITSPSNKIAKDIRALASLVSSSMQARAAPDAQRRIAPPPDRRKGLLGMSARKNE